MNKKALSILALLMLMVSVFSITSVNAAIPNPNQIIYATFGFPETVDPNWAYDTASAELIQNIIEPLWMYNGTGTNVFIPMLGETWPGCSDPLYPGYPGQAGNALTPLPPHPGYASDGSSPAPAGTDQTWYVKIRTGVQWQNPTYGNLTPADVEYTLERGMLMDHTGGPQWMIYDPLLDCMGSYAFGNVANNVADYNALAAAVDGAIESNSTHVWFNLAKPFAPFQQVMVMSWGMVMNKQWCIDHGLWKGNFANFTDFQRTYDPPAPGPLMLQPDAPGPVVPGPVLMGTGPYKLLSINPDPHTGFYNLQRFTAYWQLWPAPAHWYNTTVTNSYCDLITFKCVEEWSNRKAQFLSTDPALQCDFTNVPRANVPEMHPGGLKDGPTYAGFRLQKIPIQVIGIFAPNYFVAQPSAWTPRLGAALKPDLLSDRNLREAFMYAMNFSQYMAEYWLGEASVPTTCMPPGTSYYNASKPTRNGNTDLIKAQAHLNAAWGGQVYAQGITIKLCYNTGNIARETPMKMIADVMMHRLSWGPGAVVDISAVPNPWSVLLPDMNAHRISTICIGWMADYPHPHDWMMPFMHSHGDYSGTTQSVQYGLDPVQMATNYVEGGLNGPPYTNALGESVTWTGAGGSWKINNTYVDHLITAAAGAPGGPGSIAEKLYNELFDIYYAEALSLPFYFSYDRHYERTWVQGWLGTYNENPISPGHYYYFNWKAPAGTLFNVDVTAEGSINNVTRVPKIVQAFQGQILDGNGLPSRVNFSMHFSWPEALGPPFIEVLVTLQRSDQDGNIFFRHSYLQSMAPTDSISVPLWIWSENGRDERWNATTGQPLPGYTGVLPPGSLAEPSAGNWTLSLYVSPSSASGGGTVTDSNSTNNKVSSPYLIHAWTWAVDVNGDGTCNMVDVGTAARAFGTGPGESRWNPYMDINADEVVNMFDIGTIARSFGKTFFGVFGEQYY